MKLNFHVIFAIALFFAPTALHAEKTNSPAAFVHPGGWVTAADIQRVRTKLAAHAEPWTSAKEKLLASGPGFDFQPHPVPTVTRAGGGVDQGGNTALKTEASYAYTLMIKWVATGDSRYGDAAIRVIDGWSAVLKEIRGSDARLAAGIYGNKFAQAAELAAYYNPQWPNKARAQKMFMEVFYPVIERGASANWGTSCMAGIISMGVFCERRDLFDQSVSAYQFGFPGRDGMCGVTQYLDDSGECAESGRDQPHTQGGIAHLLETAATAWNQGTNLFACGTNRLILGLEYTAKYNLGNDVPYHPFVTANGKVIYPNGISEKNRGHYSPIYEMANCYFELAGLPAPYTKQVRDSAGYAPEVTNDDHPGLGTLMFVPEPVAGAKKKPL
jgi:hypothetical protein